MNKCLNLNKKLFYYSLILFSSYSAITLGQTWDEGHLSKQGQITLNYLLSLGRIDEYIFRREYYSPIYYSLKYLFLQIFPMKYQFEVNHLINLSFSLVQFLGLHKCVKNYLIKKLQKLLL